MIEDFQSCAICNSKTPDNRRGGRCITWHMSKQEGIFMIECGLMICNLCWNTKGIHCNECKSELLKAEERLKEKREKRKLRNKNNKIPTNAPTNGD